MKDNTIDNIFRLGRPGSFQAVASPAVLPSHMNLDGLDHLEGMDSRWQRDCQGRSQFGSLKLVNVSCHVEASLSKILNHTHTQTQTLYICSAINYNQVH